MSKERAARIANSPGARRVEPRWEEVRFGLVPQQLQPGRDDRPEEGRGPQGKPQAILGRTLVIDSVA